jgi:OmpA-OmpF porin, OOP family
VVSKGIEASRVASQGFSSSRPVADNATPEGRAKNRRVDFVLSTK